MLSLILSLGGDIESGLWCCFCQFKPSATPTCSDYTTEQTAPADSLAPGWLNINVENLCTSSSQRISKACGLLFPETHKIN